MSHPTKICIFHRPLFSMQWVGCELTRSRKPNQKYLQCENNLKSHAYLPLPFFFHVLGWPWTNVWQINKPTSNSIVRILYKPTKLQQNREIRQQQVDSATLRGVSAAPHGPWPAAVSWPPRGSGWGVHRPHWPQAFPLHGRGGVCARVRWETTAQDHRVQVCFVLFLLNTFTFIRITFHPLNVA